MENSDRDVQNVLQRFRKVEIIENFIPKLGKHVKIKKKDIIKLAINILKVKFSDLGELILFLHLKYLEIETKNKRFWKVYEIEDSKRFSEEVLQPDEVKNKLVHYFEKYYLPCNTAYAINKGNCIWIALDFRSDSAPKVVYLIAHKLLSVVFLSAMKPYPEIEKIIRRTFRGSGITQLKSIMRNAHRISNLNLEKFQILQGYYIRIQENENTLVSKETDIPQVENGLPEKAGTSSATRGGDISPPENMIPIKAGIPPFKLNEISEKGEVVVVQNGISEKTGVSPVKKRALGINSMSEKAGMLSVKGRALKYQKHSISENIEESSSNSTIPEKLEISPSESKISHERVISSLKRKDSGENKISEKKKMKKMSEIKSSTQGKEEISPQLDCIDEIAEENIESFERGKKSQENLENENLPKIECLKYTIRSPPFYEKKEDKAKHTVCSVTFYGTDVLQGIIKLTECGVADKPLPDYLYKEPRTGNNEFKLTFRDDK